jgi:DNA repair exonuclease SbcCD ATPase subunit
MKIIELEIENVKRIKAVDLKPSDDVVVVSGKNGQGKTSVLDAIWWVLAGAKHIQAVPIRKGETKGRIKAHLGDKVVELIVERRFTEGSSTVRVTTADGFIPPGGAQSVLDALLGELSFDPLEFARSDAKKQFADLLRIFPVGVDLEQVAAQNRADYERRTVINRDAKAARVKAEAIKVRPDLPAEPVDESALIDKMTAAATENTQIEQRKAKRKDTEQFAMNARSIASQIREKADNARQEAARLDAEASAKDAEADALLKKLANAEPLPEPTDIDAIRAEIITAKDLNEAIAARSSREQLEAEAKSLEVRSSELTKAIEERERTKVEALAAAKFPVDGLGFGDGVVTINGVPLEQASASEALKVSVAIGLAANPKLRVMLIRDGSLLDEDSRAQVAAMAQEADTQLWIEVARTDEPTGFIIEDGTARAVEGSAS